MQSAVTTRFVEERDLVELTQIYNHYVIETPITFDTKPFTPEERRPWLERFDRGGPHRCFVAEESGAVLGWAATIPFRAKPAYSSSAEVSTYLAPHATGRGLGTRLYEVLFDDLADAGLHRLLAGITLPNAASLALHERFGFEPVGTFREVGFKLDRYWDVAWLEKAL